MVTLQTITSSGIFRGLPTFPIHDGKKYSAIITGANGITGRHMVDHLAKIPQRWETIYALSRKGPVSSLPHVKCIAVDFLTSTPNQIAKTLTDNDVKADYIFFFSYSQPPPLEGAALWSDVNEMERQNVNILKNFLEAIEISQIFPKRFLLQTGGKHYGVHLGPTRTSLIEDDPRVLTAPNFYFTQEDMLFEWAKKNNSTWNVTRPGYILGAVENAAMNIVYSLVIYATVQKEMGLPLTFPSDVISWDAEKHLSMAKSIAYHAEWAVLTEEAANQALNHTDGGVFSYGSFWPTFASWYGIYYTTPEADSTKYTEIVMPFDPPPRGFGGPGKIHAVYFFQQWASFQGVREAWQKVAKRHNLIGDPFENAVTIQSGIGLLDMEIPGPWGRVIRLDKSRRLGWNGYVQTEEAIRDTIHELAALKMVPPLSRTAF